MCYNAPGPRCSPHAKAAYQTAQMNYMKDKNKKTGVTTDALHIARAAYYLTPAGIKELDIEALNLSAYYDADVDKSNICIEQGEVVEGVALRQKADIQLVKIRELEEEVTNHREARKAAIAAAKGVKASNHEDLEGDVNPPIRIKVAAPITLTDDEIDPRALKANSSASSRVIRAANTESPKTLHYLAETFNADALFVEISENKVASVETLSLLVDKELRPKPLSRRSKGSSMTLPNVASHENTAPADLVRIGDFTNAEHISRRLAANKNSPAEVLLPLLSHKSEKVRKEALANPNVVPALRAKALEAGMGKEEAESLSPAWLIKTLGL